jgi:hypothetical protein
VHTASVCAGRHARCESDWERERERGRSLGQSSRRDPIPNGVLVKTIHSRHRATERVMTPVEFLARLAPLVAPPRYPLVRLHGVFAARHAWRDRVVPRPPATSPMARSSRTSCGQSCGPTTQSEPSPPAPCHGRHGTVEPGHVHGVQATENAVRPSPASGDGASVFDVRQALPTSSLTASGLAVRIAPNILSIHHWERLDGGELYAATSRLDWATLLRRTFSIDLRICARCGGPLSIRSVITDQDTIDRRLADLRRPRDPPAAA